jgi:hypothetical protein
VDELHDVDAIDHEGPRGRHAQRDVQGRSPFRDVDGLAAEHRPHLLREPAFRRELPQELQRLVGDEVLREVEIETRSL